MQVVRNIAVLLALWSPLVASACCHDRLVDHPVVVRPPSCLVRPAPLAPDAEPCSERWAEYYVDLSAWVVEVEASCGERQQAVAASSRPDPGPAWWAKQPVVTHGD